jgi:glycosyltransferase involved in cell wall biosynthesis
MACGVPVITSRGSSLEEVAGDAALLVDPLSVGEIEAAIERMVSDATLRADLSAKGLARSAQFSYESAARIVVGVYERLAGSMLS